MANGPVALLDEPVVCGSRCTVVTNKFRHRLLVKLINLQPMTTWVITQQFSGSSVNTFKSEFESELLSGESEGMEISLPMLKPVLSTETSMSLVLLFKLID